MTAAPGRAGEHDGRNGWADGRGEDRRTQDRRTPDRRTQDRRTSELAANLAALDRRITNACAAAGRARSSVTLIAISKTWPADDVRRAARLGVTDVGENRDQEAAPKHAACADLGLRWHFVGQLQTNKARSVASYADVVHSVDRERLVAALSRAATAGGRTVRCLVQVALGERSGQLGPRGGVSPDAVPWLADLVAASPGLQLGGLMAVAPLGADPAAAFGRLHDLSEQLRHGHPQACDVSAGMTADLEAAVAAGATHLRIGTAVFGSRPTLG